MDMSASTDVMFTILNTLPTYWSTYRLGRLGLCYLESPIHCGPNILGSHFFYFYT